MQRREPGGERTPRGTSVQREQHAVGRDGDASAKARSHEARRGRGIRRHEGRLRRGQPHLARDAEDLFIGMLEVPPRRLRQLSGGTRAPEDRQRIACAVRRRGVLREIREEHRRRLQPGLPEDAHQSIERRLPAEQRGVHHQELALRLIREVRRRGTRPRHAANRGSQPVDGAGEQPSFWVDGAPEVDPARQARCPVDAFSVARRRIGQPAAAARSSTRSSASSNPIDTRTRPGVRPAAASSSSPS